MDHPDARSDGVAGGAKRLPDSSDPYFSMLRPIVTEDDLHQGGLAGSIFTHHGMALTRTSTQIDVAVGPQISKPLGNPAKIQGKGFLGQGLCAHHG
jgi:hypothetical protein